MINYNAEDNTMASIPPLHLDKDAIATNEMNNNSHDTDDDHPITPTIPLHRLFGSFDEHIKRREDYYKRPLKEVVSEPRPVSRQRTGSAGYVSSRLFNDDDDDSQFSEWVPETSLGLRQRKVPAARALPIAPDCAKIRGAPDPATILRRTLPIQRPRSRWLIPAEHYLKVLWDIMTVVLSIANAHATHVSIGKRDFSNSKFLIFCHVWFLVDMLLNFVTERKTAEGIVLRDFRSICARYLTSWFAVDALSLLPWESLYVQPLFDIQNKRGFFQKSFFRSKAVVRVSRHLRGKHFRWFGTAAKHARHHGIGASRLLRLVIKYLPKYLLFFRNMKGVVAVRVLRQVHWFRRFYRNILQSEEKGDGMTGSLTRDDFEDDLSSNVSFGDSRSVRVVYEGWEQLEDDDDGVPL